jgi:hypothetical protein
MPVVNADEVAKVAKDIQNGTIDYTGPYSSEVKDKLKVDHINKRMDTLLKNTIIKVKK